MDHSVFNRAEVGTLYLTWPPYWKSHTDSGLYGRDTACYETTYGVAVGLWGIRHHDNT